MANDALEQMHLIEQAAESLISRGLREPALAFLAAGEPLAFLGAQLLWISQPLVSLVQPTDRLQQWAEILERPETVHLLRQQLQKGEG